MAIIRYDGETDELPPWGDGPPLEVLINGVWMTEESAEEWWRDHSPDEGERCVGRDNSSPANKFAGEYRTAHGVALGSLPEGDPDF